MMFMSSKYRFKHKEGHYRWFRDRFTVRHNAQGQPVARIGCVSDITERKQAQEAVRDSEQRFRQLIEHAPLPLCIVKRDKTITYVNNRFTQLFGYTLEDIPSLNEWWPLAYPDEVYRHWAIEAFKAAFYRSTQEGTDIEPIEFNITCKDGSVRVVVVSGITIYPDSLGVFTDITERKLAEEALVSAAQRDHHIAEVLQQMVMPSNIPMLPAGYCMAIKYQPALQEADVCGDFCDVFELGEGRIGISIGDIVGKGLLAAMRVTAVKNMIRSYSYLNDQPSTVMSLVNNALCRDIADENDMLTAFFAVLDTRNATLRYSNAGHEPPLLRHIDGTIEALRSGGTMFCGMGKQDYLEDCYSFQAGDTFVAVSDGITEASIDKRSEQFGAAGIVRCVSKNASASCEQISTAIIKEATDYANGALRDDATVVVIEILHRM